MQKGVDRDGLGRNKCAKNGNIKREKGTIHLSGEYRVFCSCSLPG